MSDAPHVPIPTAQTVYYRAGVAVLTAMGLAHAILAPDAHKADAPPDWPHPDRAVRDEFHARWTWLMLMMDGRDPKMSNTEAFDDRRQREHSARTAERTATIVELYVTHERSAEDIAAALALGITTVRLTLRDADVPLRPVPRACRMPQGVRRAA